MTKIKEIIEMFFKQSFDKEHFIKIVDLQNQVEDIVLDEEQQRQR